MNCLTQALADLCHQNLLDEKWLVAPSRRVGQQWLESVTRGGQPIVNVRIKTVTSLAIDLAAEQMATNGVTLVSSQGGNFLIARILHRLRPTALSYLSHLDSSAGLVESVFQTINDIRSVGIDAADIDSMALEVAAKGQDLRALLQAYSEELKANRLIDRADLLRMATALLQCGSVPKVLLLLPAGLEMSFLEEVLLRAFPESARRTLPVDEPFEESRVAVSDLQLLRWLKNPTDAPPPIGDGTVRICHAVGEINEVRDVLRSCVSGEVRFDDMELLHTDSETYLPIIYETFCTLAREGETLGDDLPVAFAEGIPCRYSRPGRALAMWLAWIADDYPQRTLVQMLREGLIEVSPSGDKNFSFSRLSGLLRGLGIGFGRDRYHTQLQNRMEGLRRRIEAPLDTNDENHELGADRVASFQRQLGTLQVLDSLCTRLMACAPANRPNPMELLTGATEFLQTLARAVNQIDRFAVLKLVGDISEMQQWLALGGGEIGFDAWEWLARLCNESRVLGSGPRPGCLHVAHVLSGGHSGRGHTAIIGLDDSRFPGAGLQDPLLLDSERRQLSPQLVTAAARLEQKLGDFSRLLARLRGKVTLSFCTRSVDDDREMFASGPVLTAFRLISGQHDGDQSDLAPWLAQQSPPASFAPRCPTESLSAAEWWLWRLCGETTVRDPESLVLAHFAHLAQGRFAAAERRRSAFTEFDGLVELAGPDLDPTHSEHRVLSANRLQTIGKCPLLYFFTYGLGIAPPDELEISPNVWLDALGAGSLLHELFETFMRELVTADRIPTFDRDNARLRELLATKVAHYRELYPVPSESVFRQQSARLEQAATTFLREEELHCVRERSRPIYLEASLGMLADGHATPLDTLEPVPINLTDGSQVWLRGRVDRIDLIGDGVVKTFAIWDYKTGSTWGYDRAKPFQQGRVLQPYLYMTMVTHRLRASVDPDATVNYFGFFFPGVKARGERITWSQEALAPGQEILGRLVQVVRSGAFMATNKESDCNYCECRGICGDVTSVVAASQTKLDFPENQILAPMRDLRRE